MAEPGALIGFAGPRVIEQITKQKLPEGFQTAEFLLEHGMIDVIVAAPGADHRARPYPRPLQPAAPGDPLLITTDEPGRTVDIPVADRSMVDRQTASCDSEQRRSIAPAALPDRREPEIVEPGDPGGLTAWDRVKLARHPDRPHTLDYISELTTDFVELHGDRSLRRRPRADRRAGQLRRPHGDGARAPEGRATPARTSSRNFGMARPEGYRKAERLMRHAEKFGMPVVTFIDTPGAEPGIGSEERGQGTAIAESLLTMAGLRTPIVAVVIGEGGSGGALAIGVADRVLMLENAIYSVASPEASATILWKDVAKASDAADLDEDHRARPLGFGMIDEIVPEENPAHERPREVIAAAGSAIRRHLGDLHGQVQQENGLDELVQHRYEKFRRIGAWTE